MGILHRRRPLPSGSACLPFQRPFGPTRSRDKATEVSIPRNLLDPAMGIFEDGESLFSPGIIVEKDQDRPSSKLYSCFTFTDLTASKLFKDFSIRRRTWTPPGLSAPQPDIASSVKAQAPTRILRLGGPPRPPASSQPDRFTWARQEERGEQEPDDATSTMSHGATLGPRSGTRDGHHSPLRLAQPPAEQDAPGPPECRTQVGPGTYPYEKRGLAADVRRGGGSPAEPLPSRQPRRYPAADRS